MIIRELLVGLGVKYDTKGAQAAQSGIDKLKGAAVALGATFTAGALARGLVHLVRDQIELGDKFDKTSKQIGLEAEALQELSFAADRSGVSHEELVNGLGLLQRVAVDTSQGLGRAVDDFKDMGISVKDANGEVKDADTLLMEIADGLKNFDSASKRGAVAMNLFGRSGRKLLPLLEGGGEGVQKLRDRARELGGVMSNEAVAAAADLKDKLTDLNFASQSWKNSLSAAIFPALGKAIDIFVDMTKWIERVFQGTRYLEIGLAALAIAATALAWPLVAPFLASLAAAAPLIIVFVALALIVDDLVQLFWTGESAIGDLIDAIFGIGTAKAIVETVNQAFQDFFQFVSDSIDWILVKWDSFMAGIGKAREFFGKVGGFLGKVFSNPDGLSIQNNLRGAPPNLAPRASGTNQNIGSMNNTAKVEVKVDPGADFNMVAEATKEGAKRALEESMVSASEQLLPAVAPY